ncbi:AraC family transcriptional regulator [Cohnella hashimotonis]|uniref:AraC family transcriptional regulator n=1 Tax=Cohnella hashimotonis TaxID=2826895 RepID=A0ABT6TNV8_9BACL|nr:AraC family transcriptional regulator [Cohnella hashimotonis]MDI4647980.1 AraC family transcriptional regulator [Cohnella hashimotonis]
MDSTDYGMLVYTPSQLARSTFLYVQHIGRWKYDDDYVITREGFESYLFQYTFSGRGYLKHEDREYELLADSVILIDCRKFHEYGTLSNEQWDVGWVHFDGNGSASYMQAIHDKYGPVIRLPVPHRFIQHQQSLIEIIRGNGVNLEAEAALHIFQLLMEVFTAGTTSPSGNGILVRQSDGLEKALQYLQIRYAEPISVDDLAREANMSKSHFTRAFKLWTGCSPIEYLIRQRITMSKSLLLRERTKSIERIAELVGFESASHYIVTFKKYENRTPLQYRKMWL